MSDRVVAEAAAAAVDGEALVELVRGAVRIPSVTGEEGRFARWVAEQLSAGCWEEVRCAEVAPGRPNVYGFAGGAGGRSLVLAGHLDTVAVDDWRRHWAGSDRADPFGGHVIDGAIWGRGVADQKAGICAGIEALRALDRTGHRPGGAVTALFVCDEESGQPGSGVSAGMRAALGDAFGEAGEHGPPADFAVYTEPTTSAIYTAQMGFLIADVALEGRSAYFGTPELGVDALRAGHALLSELWRHSAELGAGGRHELLGEAFLLVTSVSAGGNIAVPGRFDLSLIQKVLPGEDLAEAAAAIEQICEQVAERHGVAAEVVFSAPRDHAVGGTPDEISARHPGVLELSRSIESTTGQPARIEGAPYWSEKPFLRSLGIPGVYFAPGDISCCHT
ncbi:MAG: M20/M25/M40 family metallo-hydrolase, partial [bacterium]|nr:M20/M25/M40 family metallo-hydrolase [bacterium]